ncbi:MAG: aldehyde dehydrogenase [Candidatus Izemoplasmatales bacterium]|nr:aldehyde dehydrogenase [Candidatus Izemoplasmatales bacterium]
MTSQKITRRASMTIQMLVEQQRTFFATGKTKPLATRIAMLKRLKAVVVAHIPAINQALMEDLNKGEAEAYLSEIGIVLSELSATINALPRWIRPKRAHTPLALFSAKSRLYPEPLGVTLVMSPWNYPFQLAMIPLIGAVAAGNTCIVKPASYAKATSQVIDQMIREAFDPEFVSCVLGGRNENQTLLDQRFDAIFFTGSSAVGKVVMEKASKYLTPVTLELGGKSPCVIDDSLDYALVAKRIAFGKLLNAGQTCVAPDYVFVPEHLVEPFVKELTAAITQMVGEDPLKNPDYPKIINQKHYERLLGLIKDETIALGGLGDGIKIAPTILINVKSDSPVMQEEIFGPILPILSYRSIDDVIEEIRKRPKPLAFYLFSKNKALQNRLFDQLSFGGATINDTIMHFASSAMGFGGVGDSGMGRYHGYHSFLTFTNMRSVLFRSTSIDLQMRYHPYTKSKQSLIRMFLK